MNVRYYIFDIYSCLLLLLQICRLDTPISSMKYCAQLEQ